MVLSNGLWYWIPYIHIYVWYRYIDDIFFIWLNTTESLDEFVNFANSFHDTIKFTVEKSCIEVPFLDLNIKLQENHICTRTYHKPTDAHNYLHFKSNHPNHQKRGIPYSQFLHMVRNCTFRKDAEYSINMLFQCFLQRGYPRKLLTQQKTKALGFLQQDLLQGPEQESSDSQQIIYITTYYPHGPRIKNILEQHKPGLLEHPHTKHMNNYLVAYKRPPNLRDILVHSNMMKSLEPGTYRCGACKMCTYINSGKHFQDRNGKTFNTIGHHTCQSTYVIYLIGCKQCPRMQYVGQTSNALKTRIYQHTRDIKAKAGTSVSAHFNSARHSLRDVTAKVISPASRTTAERLHSERAWMITLGSMSPWGLNVQN